ncbi:MAG: GNAT family N-acetyltransferase [Lachnospiraceae bacterium]
MYKLRIRTGKLKQEDKRKIDGLVNECLDYEELGLSLDTESEDDVWGMLFHDTVLVSVVCAVRMEDHVIEMTGFTKPSYRENCCCKRVMSRVLRFLQKEQVLDLNRDTILIPVDGGEDGSGMMAAWGLQSAYSEYVLAHPTVTGWKPEQMSVRVEKSRDKELLTRLHSSIFEFEQEVSREFVKDMLKDNFTVAYVIYKEKEAAGLFFLFEEEEQTWLCGFGLLPLYRRKGIATEVLDWIVTSQGDRTGDILLQVADLNEAAFALYTNYGFADRRILTYYELKKEKIEELTSVKS